MKKINLKVAVVLGLFFGGFQAGMPVIGWALGSQFMSIIGPIDHWIAFVLLALIGFNMIKESREEEEEEEKPAKPKGPGIFSKFMTRMKTLANDLVSENDQDN